MNVQKKRIGNIRSSDRKFKLMILKNKERYAPHPCKDNFARFSVADPLLLARRWRDRHLEPSRAVAVLDEIRARRHVPSLRLASPARLKRTGRHALEPRPRDRGSGERMRRGTGGKEEEEVDLGDSLENRSSRMPMRSQSSDMGDVVGLVKDMAKFLDRLQHENLSDDSEQVGVEALQQKNETILLIRYGAQCLHA